MGLREPRRCHLTSAYQSRPFRGRPPPRSRSTRGTTRSLPLPLRKKTRSVTSAEIHRQRFITHCLRAKYHSSLPVPFRHPRLRDPPPSLPPCPPLFPSNTRTDNEKSGHDGAGDPHVKNTGRGMTLPGIHGVVEWWATAWRVVLLGRGSPLFSPYCLSKIHGTKPCRPFAAPPSPPRTACARAGPVCVVMWRDGFEKGEAIIAEARRGEAAR